MIKERKQNSTSYPIVFFMADSTDHNTGKTGLSPTVQLSKNGAGFGAALGAVSEIGLGFYSLAGNATDRNTLGPLIMVATATGADTSQAVMNIVLYDPYDANLGLTNLDAAVSTRSSHNAAAVWAAETRALTDKTGFSLSTAPPTKEEISTKVWGETIRALTDKAGFTLDSAYDAAKSAASQTSVNAIPTTPLLAANYTAPANSNISSILTVIQKLDAMLELDGALYQFTTNALENVPESVMPSVPTIEEIREEMDANSTVLSAIQEQTDKLHFTGDDVKATLDGETVALTPVATPSWEDVVEAPVGTPLEGAKIEAYSDSDYGTIVATATTDINGAFSLDLGPGTYYVKILKAGYSFDPLTKVVA